MTWNHRVIRKIDPQTHESYFQIHEVYYDENGNIENWTEEAVHPFGESLSELREEIYHFLWSFRLPVLEGVAKNGKQKLITDQEELSINQGHYSEYLDRVHVASEYIYQFLSSHPLMKKEKNLQLILSRIEDLFGELYQETGKLVFKDSDVRE